MTHRWPGRAWSALIAVVVAVAVFAVAIRSAPADSGSEPLGQDRFPMTDDIREAERAAREAYEAATARRATPEAREERVRSRTAYRGLGRTEALALAERVFSGVFGDRAFTPVDLPDGAHVEDFFGSSGAVVRGGGEPQFLESVGVPLTSTVGSGERGFVDMSLRPVDGGFEPRNPVTPLRISNTGVAQLEKSGVDVKVDGVRVGLDPITEKGRVFLAGALPDTDLVVEPAPAGVSFGFQLRSVDAPEQATLFFDLPADTTLRMGSGSDADTVDLVDAGDEVIARVDAPAAWDADGEQVPVHYELDGARVRVVVTHRGRDVHYPLYVDPVYEEQGVHMTPPKGWPWSQSVSGSPVSSTSKWGWALGDPMRIGNLLVSYSANEWGAYSYQNPRGYIATLQGFYVSHRNPQSTCAYMGVLGADRTYWKGGDPWDKCTQVLDQSPVVNTNDWAYDDWATFRLKRTTAGTPSQIGDLLARGVRYTLEDTEYPTISGSTSVPNDTNGAWTDGGVVVTATPTGRDLGLGMYRFTLALPDGSLATSWVKNTGDPLQSSTGACTGVYGNRCPIDYVTGAIKVNTDDLNEGNNTYVVRARDLLGKTSSATAYTTRVKVDRSAPTADDPDPNVPPFSGPLWDSKDRLVTAAKDLNVTFSDPHSGLDWTQFLIDGSAAGLEELTCGSGAECPTKTAARTLSFDPAEQADGTHTVDAQARDGLGHELATVDPFDVLVDNTAPSQPELEHVDQPDASTWWDGTAAVTARTSDQGTAPAGDWGSGIERLELLDGDDVIATKDYSCDNTISGRCRESESATFDYSAEGAPPAGATQLAEGKRTLAVKAYDNAGRVSALSESWEVNVDRSAPTLTVSGALRVRPDRR